MELQGRVDELTQAGIGVAGISYDSVETLAAFAEARGITFPLLSDQGSAVIREYGILNTVAIEMAGDDADDPVLIADAGKFGSGDVVVGTPFPGSFMLDANHRVTARYFEEYYRERNTAANIMLQLGMDLPPVAAIRGSSPELSFTAYPSDTAVFAGSRFAIAVDVVPNADMHVYAPGAEEQGYRVTGLRLDPHPNLRFEPVQYPASEIYHFEPLDEYVPVYQAPFTLLQEVVVDASSEAQAILRELDELTVTGSFDYQACDHEICYLPGRAPLTFTLDIVERQ